MTMNHPGLAIEWVLCIIFCMGAIVVWQFAFRTIASPQSYRLSFTRLPLFGGFFAYLASQTKILLILKLIALGLFSLIIVSGLWGSQIAERNLSTVLTWNLWWTGVIISIWFFGSSWCAICPWDLIANFLVRKNIWGNNLKAIRLNLTVPGIFRNLWSALIMLTALTWLELGIGVTDNPYATSSLALLMVVLATLSLVIYKDKAFCRYFCPVGRTIGVYSQLSPIALRPVIEDICQSCTTLECYHGNQDIAPCPTKLVMGRLTESSYCISCGNCTQSCPDNNINWQIRSPNVEAVQEARPHLDEAGFMMGLLGLTSFHGLTMLPVWQEQVSQLARMIGDSGQLIMTFTLMMFAVLSVTFLLYGLFVYLFKLVNPEYKLRQIFSGFAFVSLPIAFCYHVAHNMNHLLRESGNLKAVLLNPLGIDTQPLSMMEKHQRAMEMMMSPMLISLMQTIMLVFGFWLAMQVVKHRGQKLFSANPRQLLPITAFCALITLGNLWLLAQPMIMRM